jgi:tetratricopeptide (TPR) repeat protein
MDDDILLTQNSIIKSPDGIAKFWLSTEPLDYWPVTNTSLWLEWRLWRNDPAGYHVTNLLLHLATIFLLWSLLRHLHVPGAYLAAVLFALHPVNVQTVAWISQRKNLLALLLLLLSASTFIRSESLAPSGWRSRILYALSLLIYVFAMLSKGSAAVLPPLLLLITWWQVKQLSWRHVLRIIPFVAVAATFTAVNLWFRNHGDEQIIRDTTFPGRIVGAGGVVWFYLLKAVAPFDLQFIYPQWEPSASDFKWWLPSVALLAVTIALWSWRHSAYGRACLVAWLFYCIALVPVLGLVDVGFMKYSLVGDHYQHIALIAVVSLEAAALATLWHSERPTQHYVAAGATAILLGTFFVSTSLYAWSYANPVRLYEDTLAKNDRAWVIHDNLGDLLMLDGHMDLALPHFKRAVALNPASANAHNNLGTALFAFGEFNGALNEFDQALSLNPKFIAARTNLATALAKLSRFDEAIKAHETATKLDGGDVKALASFADTLREMGRYRDAISRYEEAEALDPINQQAILGHANALLDIGRTDEAIRMLRSAITANGDSPMLHYNLAVALAKRNYRDAAATEYEEAIRLKPAFAEAHSNLANLLRNSGKNSEALEHYLEALRNRPEYPEAAASLATLYAELGKRKEAIDLADRAIRSARSSGQDALAMRIEEWLSSFKQQRTD